MDDDDSDSEQGDLFTKSRDLLTKSSSDFSKQKAHLAIKSKTKSENDFNFNFNQTENYIESEIFENFAENRAVNAKHKLSESKKKFIKSINTITFCYRWCKWAIRNYNRVMHRYISFCQIADTEDLTTKIIREIDSRNKDESDQKLAIHAKTRAEMMNFNLNFFKSGQRLNSKLTDDIKSLLAIDNKNRSKKDIDFLIFTFKKMTHMKCVNDLLPETLRKFFRLAWLEEYTPKRIIVNQDRKPEFFYIIVHGSLVCTYRPKNERKSHTICLLEKGMTFGDLGLLSDSTHTSSATTREDVQLLVVTKQDFFNIFVNSSSSDKTTKITDNLSRRPSTSLTSPTHNILNGSHIESKIDQFEAKNPNKNLALHENVEFLREVKFLKSWPLNILIEKPKLLKQCRFPQDKIISHDSSVSKHIYIIKSGSISVWIKIKAGGEDTGVIGSVKPNESDFKQAEASYFERNYFLEEHHFEILGVGEQQRNKSDAEKLRDIEGKMNFNQIMKYLANVKNVDAESTKESVNSNKFIRNSNVSLSFKEGSKRNLPSLDRKNASNLSFRGNRSSYAGMKFKLPDLVNSSYFNMKSLTNQRRSDVNISRESKHSTTINTPFYQTRNLRLKANRRQQQIEMGKEILDTNSTSISNITSSKSDLKSYNSDESRNEYLLIKKLNVGDYFGLADILFNAQPSMQLISNGCECILLPKDLFIENSTINYLRELRKTEEPYPKLEDIQHAYNSNISWKSFTKQMMHTELITPRFDPKKQDSNFIKKINV